MSALCGTPTSRSAGTENEEARTTNMNTDMVLEPEHGVVASVLSIVRRMESASCQRRSRCAGLGRSSHAVSWTTPRQWVALKAARYVIIACMLLSDVAMAATAHTQPYPEVRQNMNTTRFDFRHFESLAKDHRVEEAQTEMERLFPPGSKADDLESYLTASGAKCTRGTDHSWGPFLTCIYTIQGLSLVTTSWTVSARLDPARSTITSLEVTRYLTGL
jgi:hypothetical protein